MNFVGNLHASIRGAVSCDTGDYRHCTQLASCRRQGSRQWVCPVDNHMDPAVTRSVGDFLHQALLQL